MIWHDAKDDLMPSHNTALWLYHRTGVSLAFYNGDDWVGIMANGYSPPTHYSEPLAWCYAEPPSEPKKTWISE